MGLLREGYRVHKMEQVLWHRPQLDDQKAERARPSAVKIILSRMNQVFLFMYIHMYMYICILGLRVVDLRFVYGTYVYMMICLINFSKSR